MKNDYELRLVEKINVELNTLLNPVHAIKVGFTRSDVDKLEAAIDVLRKIELKSVTCDDVADEVFIF